jgi:hypothetical protein
VAKVLQKGQIFHFLLRPTICNCSEFRFAVKLSRVGYQQAWALDIGYLFPARVEVKRLDLSYLDLLSLSLLYLGLDCIH